MSSVQAKKTDQGNASGPPSKVIAEYDNGAAPSSPSREYIYSGAMLLAKIEGGASIYYHPDHLSNRVLTDSSGNVLGQRGHYPFGDTWYESGTATKLKFTSYERDAESGLDYFGARYNSSQMGRFMSPDETLVDQQPEDPQSWNLYSYVRNNPLNNTDPTGNACVSDGNGGWKDDGSGGQSCAEANDPKNNKTPSAIVTADPMSMSWRQFFGLDKAYNQIQDEREQQFLDWIKNHGGTNVRAELPIGPGDIDALIELLRPSGAKLAQIIARLGKGLGSPEIAMKELTAIRDAAAGAGQSTTGFYIKADSTIYRVGNDYLTVAKDGRVLGYVKNATPGEGVALRYSQLGGK